MSDNAELLPRQRGLRSQLPRRRWAPRTSALCYFTSSRRPQRGTARRRRKPKTAEKANCRLMAWVAGTGKLQFDGRRIAGARRPTAAEQAAACRRASAPNISSFGGCDVALAASGKRNGWAAVQGHEWRHLTKAHMLC